MAKLEQQLNEEERFIEASTNIDEKTSKEILKIKQRSIDTLREQREITRSLIDNLSSPSMMAERLKQIASPDAVKMDRNLEVKINNENFMNFKIIDSNELKFMTGIEQRIVNFICKNFGKKFIFEHKIETGETGIKTRILDGVGPQGVLELKLKNKDLIRSSFDMFIPENVSKEQKFYKNYFNLVQSAKKLLKEISKEKFNFSNLVTDFIKELQEEHRLKYRIKLEKIPNIKKYSKILKTL